MPTKVSSPNRERSLTLGDGNAYSCPEAVIRSSSPKGLHSSASPALRRPSINLSASAGLRNGMRAIWVAGEYRGLMSFSSRHTAAASPRPPSATAPEREGCGALSRENLAGSHSIDSRSSMVSRNLAPSQTGTHRRATILRQNPESFEGPGESRIRVALRNRSGPVRPPLPLSTVLVRAPQLMRSL